MKRTATLLCVLLSVVSFAQTGIIQIVKTTPASLMWCSLCNMTNINNKLYFHAYDTTDGHELWWADAQNNPVRATNLMPLKEDGVVASTPIGKIGNNVYFIGRYQSGAIQKQAFFALQHGGIVIDSQLVIAHQMLTYNNELYIMGSSASGQHGLFHYDPNVGHVVPIHTSSSPMRSKGIVRSYNKIYYLMGSEFEQKLFEYDPATQTHSLMLDKTPSYGGITHIEHIVSLGGIVYLSAKKAQRGLELYRLVNPGAPIRIADLATGTTDEVQSELMNYNGAIYLQATDGSQTSLYSYNYYGKFNKLPNTSSTVNLPPQTSVRQHLGAYRKKIFYSRSRTNINNGEDVFAFNTVDSTVSKLAIPALGTHDYYRSFTAIQDALFFVVYDSVKGNGLVRYKDQDLSINTQQLPTSALYPNPTKGDATLELSLAQAQELSLQLTDVTGRIVYQIAAQEYEQGKHQVVMPTRSLAAGVYLYQVTNSNGELLSKGRLVKE